MVCPNTLKTKLNLSEKYKILASKEIENSDMWLMYTYLSEKYKKLEGENEIKQLFK